MTRLKYQKSIDMNSETYFLYFIRLHEEIIGATFSSNKIYSDENGIINIDTNIASPHIFNEKYCSAICIFKRLYLIINITTLIICQKKLNIFCKCVQVSSQFNLWKICTNTA